MDLPIAIQLKILKTPLYTDETHFSVGEWKIETSVAYDYTVIGGWDKMITFTMEVARYPSHYLTIIIVPTVVIAILTYVTFFLPLKSGVRIGYILTVVLAMVVLLTLFADTMPPSSRFPSVIGKIVVIKDMFVHSIMSCVFLNSIPKSFHVAIVLLLKKVATGDARHFH